jgi:glycerophosphoryl diester phosphodiesterase
MPQARVLLVAHRTPPSTQACAELAAAGARVFEIDVQPSRRGVVVSHFLPTFGVRGWLENDGRRVRLSRRVAVDPLLSDVLAHVPTDGRVLLDPKETQPGRRVLLREQLAAELPDRARYVVSTDDPDDLDAYRRLGFGTWRTIGDDGALRRALAGGTLPDQGISLRESLATGDTVPLLRRLAPLTVAWTVNDLRRAAVLVGLGIGGLTTDRPEVVRWAASLKPDRHDRRDARDPGDPGDPEQG